MPPKKAPKKIERLKAPKKVKPLKINPKKHINKLENMNPFLREQQKNLDIMFENHNVRNDSDYETSSSESESSSSDSDDIFKPEIAMGNRRVEKNEDEDIIFKGVNITYIPTNKDSIKQRPLHEQGIVPRGYSNFVIINGSIGSGKTNCLVNMMLNPLIYGFDGSDKHWYDNLYVLSNSNDDCYDILTEQGILKPSHIKHQPEAKHLKEILDKQKEAIKNAGDDVGKIPNTCIIMDDVIDDKNFINSKEFKLCAIRPRQMHLCVFLLSQHFHSIPRINRVNAQNLILFSGNKTEEEMYTDMLCPSGMSRKQFSNLLNKAWEKRPDDKYPFLHVNRKQPNDKRFMRNFTEYIDLEDL
jgi:hypothetical protein